MDKGHTVKLFVGNLALDTTQEELSAIFEPYGHVVSCSVLRQFAFVHIQGEGAAERAIRELNGREFRGRNLVVEESRGRPLHSTKVFVGNLSGMCTTEDLQQLFQTFGKVLECDKVKGRHSSSVGYAFVHMENKEDALQAIEALHGTSFKGRPLSVELSKVQPSKQTPTGKIPCVSCGKQGHYAGQQVVAAEQQTVVSKPAERDRSPLRRTAPLLPDPIMKPFIYQRAKPRRSLLPTPAGRAAEEAASEATEDHVARYYAEYYQQLQQYPHFQYAYPSPGAMTAIQGMQAVPAMSAQPVATLDALRPVVPAAAAAMAAAIAAPRVYEPPLPPTTRKESVLRRPELSLHTPEPPFR
ncbi:uncharacterized protein LOC144004335 isoform X3 [Festucalex cinctus]